MKLLKILILAVAPLLLLNACGPKEMTRLSFDKVESFRAERAGLGSVEGTATVSLYSGNKKNVIFDSGQVEVALNGRTFGVITLQKAVVVRPGFSKTEVPVRVRFARDGFQSLAELVFPKRGQGVRRPEIRIAGQVNVVAGDPLRSRTLRFNRKLTPKMASQLGEMCNGLF